MVLLEIWILEDARGENYNWRLKLHTCAFNQNFAQNSPLSWELDCCDLWVKDPLKHTHRFLRWNFFVGFYRYVRIELGRMATDLVIHKGGCHCKRVRYSVRAPANVVVWECDCSSCAMRRNIHFIVPQSDFELDPASEEFLTLYTFGTHTAKHLFCKVCGITSYYIPRSNPDGVAVTLNCIDPGTITHVEKRTYDGKDWDSGYLQSEISSFSKLSWIL